MLLKAYFECKKFIELVLLDFILETHFQILIVHRFCITKFFLMYFVTKFVCLFVKSRILG